MRNITWLILIIVISSCTSEKITPEEVTARYTVTFIFIWNEQDFPVDYPSGAHFSKLIGWSHKPGSGFFQTGTLASEGIKRMAEIGATSPLDNEINNRIANNEGLNLVIGDNLSGGVGEITIEIAVNKENPSVTLCTMIAPSPDWYVAVVSINLYENGSFVQERIVDVLVYDAGTDGGLTYMSANDPTDPREPISLFVKPPLGNGTSITPSISVVKFSKL